MIRRLNKTKIRKDHMYTYGEISKLFERTVCTVGRWVDKGLKVVDPNRTPRLVLGLDLIDFVVLMNKKNRIKLGLGEFRCSRCRKARESKNNAVTIVLRDFKTPKGGFQVDIYGVCNICGSKLVRFSSQREIEKLLATNQLFVEQGQVIIWGTSSPINAYFEGSNNE